MPAPGGTFIPNGRFGLPRSYAAIFVLNVTAAVIQTDNEFHFTDPLNPAVNFHITIDPRFWDWNSNYWTLDWIIEQSFYYVLPVTTPIPMPFTLTWYSYGSQGLPSIVFNPFGILFPDDQVYTLPPAPPTYWQPPFPAYSP